jgi:hypothetical protein
VSTIPNRLREGERWPAAELVLRGLGLALLLASWRLAGFARRLAIVPAGHHAPLAEYAVCLGAVALLSAGIALTIEGPGLFRHVPLPGRSGNY